jgi:hypothetical protein
MRPMCVLVVLAVCLSLVAESTRTDAGQNKSAEPGASDKPKGLPYTEGTVWSLTFVRTKPGMTNDYIRNLASVYRKIADEMKKEGLIVSYKVLMGSAANKDDWDIMTMLEYKNMAALDGIDEKVEAIVTRTLGTEEKVKEGNVKRNEIRDILGEKIVREVIFK